jgi:hypothetical protein
MEIDFIFMIYYDKDSCNGILIFQKRDILLCFHLKEWPIHGRKQYARNGNSVMKENKVNE